MQEDISGPDTPTREAGDDAFGLNEGIGATLVTDFTPGEDILGIRATGARFEDLTFSAQTDGPDWRTRLADQTGGPALADGAAANETNIPPAPETDLIFNGNVVATLQGVATEDLRQEDFITAAQADDDTSAIDLGLSTAQPDLLAIGEASVDSRQGAGGLQVTDFDGRPIAPEGTVLFYSGVDIEMLADRS
ncbi:MAG: hypothetical protein AAF231_03590 [Pseudomonadota bacterium]